MNFSKIKKGFGYYLFYFTEREFYSVSETYYQQNQLQIKVLSLTKPAMLL